MVRNKKQFKGLFRSLTSSSNQFKIPNIIRKQVRKNKSVIFGARSLNAQSSLFKRDTRDWDIFSKHPKKSATQLEKKLDRVFGFDKFYTKPAQHPGTTKVVDIGQNRRRDKFDKNIADFSRTPKDIRFVTINQVRFRTLAQEKGARLNALRDPAFKFRASKDKKDLETIRLIKKFGRRRF